MLHDLSGDLLSAVSAAGTLCSGILSIDGAIVASIDGAIVATMGFRDGTSVCWLMVGPLVLPVFSTFIVGWFD